jgi:hypothetical protein
MDDIVRRALEKWPDVPACTGWLLLDRRGGWRMRDETAQQAGDQGALITHAALLGFIHRNYAADDLGQWYFQNGPQRVFVELAYTPWIVRLSETVDGPRLNNQAGAPFAPAACWLDEAGNVLFSDTATRPHLALLHDHDLDLLADRLILDDGERVDPAHDSATRQDAQAAPENALAGATGMPATPAGRQVGTLHWSDGRQLPVFDLVSEQAERRFGFVRSPAAREQAVTSGS